MRKNRKLQNEIKNYIKIVKNEYNSCCKNQSGYKSLLYNFGSRKNTDKQTNKQAAKQTKRFTNLYRLMEEEKKKENKEKRKGSRN